MTIKPNINEEEVSPIIVNDTVSNDDSGSGIGFLAGSSLTYISAGYIGLKILKKIVISGPVKSIVAKTLLDAGVKTAVVKKAGLFKLILGKLGWGSAVKSGTQLSMYAAQGKIGLMFSALKGGLVAAATKVGTFLTGALGISLGIVAVGVWAVLYLAGNADMKEIKQVWKNGRHGISGLSGYAKEIYKNAAAGLYSAKLVGLTFPGHMTYMAQNNGRFIVRIKDEEKSEAYLEEYFFKIQAIGEGLVKSELMTEIFAGDDSSSWVKEIENEYAGLPVSGKKETDNYDLIRGYITKYMFENADDDKNYYNKAIAEEGEGWYDTAFGANIPGLSVLGWSSWMISEGYLNTVNSIINLKTRPWLWEVIKCYWDFPAQDISGNDFNITQFSKFSKRILGDTILSDPNFLNQLEYGILTEDGEYKKSGDFSQLIKECGSYLTVKNRENARNDKSVPVTNLSISFSAFYATYSLLYSIYEGAVTYLALLQLIGAISENEREILKKYSVDDEWDEGKVVKQNSEDPTTVISDDPANLPKEASEETADQIINAFKNLPDLMLYKG